MRTYMFLFSLLSLSNFSLGCIGNGEVMCFLSLEVFDLFASKIYLINFPKCFQMKYLALCIFFCQPVGLEMMYQ